MIQSQEKQLAMQETKEREDHTVHLHSISIGMYESKQTE